MKKCTKCQITKSLNEYNKSQKNKDGLNTWCRTCCNKYSKQWAQKNKERHLNNYKKWRAKNIEHANDLDRKRAYGLPKGRYSIILKLQNGCCAICKTNSPAPKKTFCVDHCHATGKVRGLLCHRCNTLLGHAKDNVETLKNAIEFLSKNIDYKEEKWGRLGEQDDYFWQTPLEKDVRPSFQTKENCDNQTEEWKLFFDAPISSDGYSWYDDVVDFTRYWEKQASDQGLDEPTFEKKIRTDIECKFDR